MQDREYVYISISAGEGNRQLTVDGDLDLLTQLLLTLRGEKQKERRGLLPTLPDQAHGKPAREAVQ